MSGILVLHPGALGDIVLALPALSLVRERFPGMSLTFAGTVGWDFLPGWKALLTGPQFPVRLHHAALTLAKPRIQRWIGLELAAIAAMVVLAFGVLDLGWLRY